MTDSSTRFEVGEAEAGMRLDLFLAARLRAFSRARVRTLLRLGRVRKNGRRVRTGDRLQTGDVLQVELAATPGELLPRAEPQLPLIVRYVSSALLVVDKPAAMPTQPLAPDETGTLVNALLGRYPELRAQERAVLDPGLLNRLDLETSGLVLVARHAAAFAALRAQLEADAVRKVYLALVHGETPTAGEVRWALAHDPRAASRMRVQHDPELGPSLPWRKAHTRFRCVARYEGLSFVEVEIRRGARHQIRAHLAALGHPIVGDRLYGAADSPRPCDRHFLHAARLELVDPHDAQAIRVEAPLPPELESWLAALGRARSL